MPERRGERDPRPEAVIDLPELARILPRARRAAEFVEPLNAAMQAFDIKGAPRIAAFLATCGHESADFSRLRENMNYSAERLIVVFPRYFTREVAEEYEGDEERIANRVYSTRMGNGPEASGDGWRFRGGGLIALTGRDAYRRTGFALNVDLEAHPERITEPSIACQSAAFYWKDRGLNALADAGDFRAVSAIVNVGNRNGKPNGWDDRLDRYKRALEVLNEA